MYDSTHSVNCEFFGYQTENITRAATVAVAIPNSAQYASLPYTSRSLTEGLIEFAVNLISLLVSSTVMF